MDNVTHSLIGVLLARASLPWTRSIRGAVWAAVLASNAPDIDIVAGPFFDDRRLGYLVHHRGYTHTFVAALLLGVGCAAIARWRDPKAAKGPIAALALLAAALHIGADAWNNYGVHPLWPFDARWFYGDFVFIVEPLLWAALLPLAWTTATGRGWRVLLAVLAVFLVGASATAVGPLTAIAVGGLLAAGGVWLSRHDGPVVPAVVALGVLGTFATAHGRAEALVRAAAPGQDVLDVVLTPMPATPWCWDGWLLVRDGGTYRATALQASLMPAWTPPADCRLRAPDAQTAPVVRLDEDASPNLRWTRRFEAPIAGLAALRDDSCRVDATLTFTRAPFWVDEGERFVVGDLRYDYEPGMGFAETETTRATPPDSRGCVGLPPWRPDTVPALLEDGAAALGPPPTR